MFVLLTIVNTACFQVRRVLEIITVTIYLELKNDLDLIQIEKNKYKGLMEKHKRKQLLQNIPNPTLAKSAYKQTLT